MLKLVSPLLLLAGLAGSAFAAFCPTQPITSNNTLEGNLPNGAANLTAVPQGTNCSFVFDIPNNYNLQLSFNAQAGSVADNVTIYDNNGQPLYNLAISATPVYNVPLYLPARAASVLVQAASGNMRFMLSYRFNKLDNYKQITKRTGEHFPLSLVAANTYVTITTSSANEKVIVSPASRAGSTDASLTQLYVFDGDNINTANVMGRLSDFSDIIVSSGQSVSIVNFPGVASNSYALGNDASTLDGFAKYTVLLTSLGTSMSGNMTDASGSVNGAAYTLICVDCSTFYWTQMAFDSFGTIANKAYITFQGQTPTHKREKLITYNAMTVTNSYFPQLVPTNVFTMNLLLGRAAFRFNNINDDTAWKKPFDGRRGYIFAPNLWGVVNNNFNYEFRDNSQLYFYTMNLDKLNFPTNGDQMTLKIGIGNGAPTVNTSFPTTKFYNHHITAHGNYMQVGLTASVTADVRLSFAMDSKQPTVAPPTVTTRRVHTTTSGVGNIDLKLVLSIVFLMAFV